MHWEQPWSILIHESQIELCNWAPYDVRMEFSSFAFIFVHPKVSITLRERIGEMLTNEGLLKATMAKLTQQVTMISCHEQIRSTSFVMAPIVD